MLFLLKMFSVIIFNPKFSYRPCFFKTSLTQVISPIRSSRTKVGFLNLYILLEDRDQTVSQRSKPISRTTLIGEHPNPWNLVQLQEVIRRHRGAKQFRQ